MENTEYERKNHNTMAEKLTLLLLAIVGDNTGLGSPDVFGVLLNGTVTGELATLGYVVDHHVQPPLPILQGGGGGGGRGG